jgi:hypothetical protein
MEDFKKYSRTSIAELRPVTQRDIDRFANSIYSVSIEDLRNGSPKIGDMIARNPKNHLDQWLIAKDYFEENFESLEDETN